MGAWGEKLAISVAGGLLVFVVLLVPVLVVQYRRYGRPSPRRVGTVSAGCVYAVALLAYTLLPLPDHRANCNLYGQVPLQLVPGTVFGDIENAAAGGGVLAVLTAQPTVQLVLNVVLFVPFGLLVRRFAGRGVLTSTVAALATSLLIEVTQGTGLWGIYRCRYRVADVDDLMANTAGALVGALLAPQLLGWLPRPDQLERGRLRPRRITTIRRWVGMLVDLAVFTVLLTLLTALWTLGHQVLGPGVPSGPQPALAVLAVAVGLLVYAVPALLGTGASIGQRVVWLAPSWPSRPPLGRPPLGRPPLGRPPLGRRLLRAGVVSGTWTLGIALSLATPALGLPQLIAVLLALPAVVSPFLVPFTAGCGGLSFLLSRTELVDSRDRHPEPVETVG